MTKHVLIIEDEPAILQLLEAVLCDEGLAVSTATDGHVALDLLRHHTPDVIVLDYMLPYMDGATFARQARHHHLLKETPILLLSAGQPEQWARAVGATACLQKPCDMPRFVQWVTRLTMHARSLSQPRGFPLCAEAAS